MLKLYYWNDIANFGDLLSPPLFERVFSTPTCFAPLHKADAVSIGSLLSWVVFEKNQSLLSQRGKRRFLWRSSTPLIIWGTGMLHGNIYPYPFRTLDIRALRGHKTQQIFSPEKMVSLGDPGLLSDKLLEGVTSKKYRIGVIPHYQDKLSPWVSWFEDNVDGATIIDVEREPLSVIRKISQCERILSSSLHGLIVADSLGIPNQWIMFENTSRTAENWKHHDYYSVFEGLDVPEPWVLSSESIGQVKQLESRLSNYRRPGLEKIKQQLIASFPFK